MEEKREERGMAIARKVFIAVTVLLALHATVAPAHWDLDFVLYLGWMAVFLVMGLGYCGFLLWARFSRKTFGHQGLSGDSGSSPDWAGSPVPVRPITPQLVGADAKALPTEG